jgi:hypothetical protein
MFKNKDEIYFIKMKIVRKMPLLRKLLLKCDDGGECGRRRGPNLCSLQANGRSQCGVAGASGPADVPIFPC